MQRSLLVLPCIRFLRKLLTTGILACFSLSTACIADNEPIVRSSPAASAPVIDGKDTDACWGEAVSIEDFLLIGSHRPAREGTSVRITHDRRALYLFARCEESLLSVAAQRQHEIKAATKKRDGKVIEDDSIIFILCKGNSSQAYEFAVNTLGIVADAKTRISNVWESRDSAWDARITTSVALEDGYWTAELAIPWSELGSTMPQDGSEWKVILARAARARDEISSWNPSGPRGVHQPEHFGRLVFGRDALGVRLLEKIDLLKPGLNTLPLAITPSINHRPKLSIRTEVVPDDKGNPPRKAETAVNPTQGTSETHHEFETSGVGFARFSWSLYDATARQAVYSSPQIHTEIQSSRVTMTVTTPGSYRFSVNGNVIAHGPVAKAHPIAFFLRNGSNLITLEAEAGIASIRTDEAEFGPVPIRWKMAPPDQANALSGTVDDRLWETAPDVPITEAGIPQMIGQAGHPVVLRHTIMLRQTRPFPLSQPALHIAATGVQGLNFSVNGLKGRTLDGWKLYLELPESVEATGTPTYFGKNGHDLGFQLQQEHRIGSSLYVAIANRPITEKKEPAARLSLFQVALRQTGKAVPGAIHSGRYWTRANDDTLSELPQALPLAMLPELNGRQPKTFRWQLWAGAFYRMGDPVSKRAVLATAKAAGFNEVVVSNEVDPGKQRWTRTEAERLGMGSRILLYFRPYGLNFIPYLEKHPEFRLIDATGKTRDSYSVCTTILLNQGWQDAGATLLKALVESVRPSALEYDYEMPPFTGTHSCYCERCLTSFRTAAKLPETLPLDGKIIAEKHRAAWVDFMAMRAAKLFLLIKNTLHELPNPPGFSVYSGYHTPDNATRYGVDWSYVGKLQAVDSAACGYGRPVKAMKDTLKALRGIPVTFGSIVSPYLAIPLKTDTPSRQLTKAELLRRALDATGGVLVYDLTSMDGRSLFSIAETTRLIAEFEQLFLARDLKPLQGSPVDDVQILKGERVALVCVMNNRAEEKTYTLTLPAGFGTSAEYYTGRKVAAGEKIRIVLPPGETAVYVMGNRSAITPPASHASSP